MLAVGLARCEKLEEPLLAADSGRHKDGNISDGRVANSERARLVKNNGVHLQGKKRRKNNKFKEKETRKTNVFPSPRIVMVHVALALRGGPSPAAHPP